MLRYYLISTVIVVTVGTLIALRQHAVNFETRAVQAHGSPSPPRKQAGSHAAPRAFEGIAPWALAALPDCARQRWRVRGIHRTVLRWLPRAARPLPRGAVVAFSNCRLFVLDSGGLIRRGVDRFEIPRARFFVRGDDLLVFRSGAAAELAEYWTPRLRL